jgi:CheY-like chemotaxis protein
VDADPQQLRRVLQNLLCNAIVHGEVSAPAIHIEAARLGDECVIRVADNGPGVDQAMRERIFEPFIRDGRRADQGFGMGLAICKRIIESHRGRLWCEPGRNGGAVFVVTLPVETPAAETPGAALKADALPAAAPAPETEHLASVLIVDDNEAAIDLARIILVDSGKLRCRLISANGAEEALSLLRSAANPNRLVDVVLLDINMPRLDGFEMLAQMQDDDALRDIPVIMCTTSSYDKDMERAKALGAVGYLAKPPEPGQLIPVLRTLSRLYLRQDGARGCALLRVA